MHRLLLGLLILPALHRPLAAQGSWALTLERGSTTFSSTAHDTSSPPVRLVPWHPALYTLRLAHEAGRRGWAVAFTYGVGDLAGRVEDVVVIPNLSLDLAEIAPEVTLRIAATPSGGILRAHLGPVLDLWLPSGSDMRTTYGGQLGATLALPLSDHWGVAVRGDFALTTGELTRSEASDQVIREPTLRHGRLGLGITRHL